MAKLLDMQNTLVPMPTQGPYMKSTSRESVCTLSRSLHLHSLPSLAVSVSLPTYTPLVKYFHKKTERDGNDV